MAMAETCASIVAEPIVDLIKKEELIQIQHRIEQCAEGAGKKGETINEEVQTWLEDAQNLKTEVDTLQKQIDMHSAGWFPNCIQRYHLGRKVAKKTGELTEHKDKSKFSEFSHLAPLRGMEYYASEGFISYQSRKRAYDQIMEALKDVEIHKIGVYGMGACGKTALVKRVGKEAEKQGRFEKVLTVDVSIRPDITKIQESIAGSLGFKFEMEKTIPERAKRLSMTLNNWGKILVILDDVWDRLDFEEIGITNNCYILLSTRSASVCNAMRCEKKIQLPTFDETEAWNLFKKHAGIADDDKLHSFKDIGQEIAKKCKGLPVAIVAMADFLNGKELSHWITARDTLTYPREKDIESAVEDIYKGLKLSYVHLSGQGAKSLLLSCSLFPEDFEIPVEHLARVAMGLGLFEKFESNNITRSYVKVAIANLIDSCLLLEGNTTNAIRMHGLVRNEALRIAKIENKMITGKERSNIELAEHSTSKDTRYLFCSMDEFPQLLNCPKLECLFIHIDSKNQVEIPDNSFNEMKDLRVLALLNEAPRLLLQLPNSIRSLTNLRFLILTGLQLGDIYFIGSLTKIEAPMLSNCSFHELPDGVAKKLRLLDLCECKIERSPYEMIKGCSLLEELYFVGNDYPKRETEEKTVLNSSVKVLLLQNLNCRGTILKLDSFKKFNHEGYSITRYLSIEYFDTCFSNATIDALIRRAEVLSFGGIHGGCKSIIPAFVQKREGMNELTKLIVYNSEQVECVVDMTNSLYQNRIVFSNLTHLEISQMKKLEKFFVGQPSHNILKNLEELRISKCNQLKHIIANEPKEIPSDHGRNQSVFPKLKLIAVSKCQRLKYLMPIAFAKALLQLKNVELEDLPNIISICPENYELIWPSLDSLKLWNCPKSKIMHDDLDQQRQQDHTFTKGCKETVEASDLEPSNKESVEEGPTFDNITLTQAKSTCSPLPGLSQIALLRRYKEERNRTLASRARVLDRAAGKLAHTLLNASKDGFENCLQQVSLHPGAHSLEAFRSMTSYLKVVRDGAIIDLEDEYEPDLSIEASDLEIGSGDEGGA
ncbi:hypothetical protein L6164_001035 [Bauhinia variegata]|uniref:Uncharacterized protein n=1 Tax=Bauhinia variegata TaxID=167791 RepID=A0ACB9QB07_BAUVA|nr:hypothetical protein L6164_001035 [Bauhinia variegata]